MSLLRKNFGLELRLSAPTATETVTCWEPELLPGSSRRPNPRLIGKLVPRKECEWSTPPETVDFMLDNIDIPERFLEYEAIDPFQGNGAFASRLRVRLKILYRGHPILSNNWHFPALFYRNEARKFELGRKIGTRKIEIESKSKSFIPFPVSSCSKNRRRAWRNSLYYLIPHGRNTF